MTELQFDIELGETAAMRKLDAAINQFAQAQADLTFANDDELPALMVKTRSRPSGKLVKSLVFRDAKAKEKFLSIFQHARRF